MDSLQALAQYLATDLGESADIHLVDEGSSGTPQLSLLVQPRDPAALPMTVYGGRGEIPAVEFGSVAGVECLGSTRVGDGRVMTPLQELGTLVAVAALHGAHLTCGRFRRRYLIVGHLDRQPAAYRRTTLKSWRPIQPQGLSPYSFLRPPDYRAIPASLLRLRAHRSLTPGGRDHSRRGAVQPIRRGGWTG